MEVHSVCFNVVFDGQPMEDVFLPVQVGNICLVTFVARSCSFLSNIFSPQSHIQDLVGQSAVHFEALATRIVKSESLKAQQGFNQNHGFSQFFCHNIKNADVSNQVSCYIHFLSSICFSLSQRWMSHLRKRDEEEASTKDLQLLQEKMHLKTQSHLLLPSWRILFWRNGPGVFCLLRKSKNILPKLAVIFNL